MFLLVIRVPSVSPRPSLRFRPFRYIFPAFEHYKIATKIHQKIQNHRGQVFTGHASHVTAVQFSPSNVRPKLGGVGLLIVELMQLNVGGLGLCVCTFCNIYIEKYIYVYIYIQLKIQMDHLQTHMGRFERTVKANLTDMSATAPVVTTNTSAIWSILAAKKCMDCGFIIDLVSFRSEPEHRASVVFFNDRGKTYHCLAACAMGSKSTIT